MEQWLSSHPAQLEEKALQIPAIPPSPDWQWRWWLPVPLYPYGQRRTLRQEVVPGWVWVCEQIQGVLYVVTPLRMTVIRLNDGGLLIYAPIAPTPECLKLVDELVAQYGAVQYIILPTISGLEHKVFVGPFARHYPSATVYVAPDQWSFPLNLPLSWLGLPLGRTKVLVEGQQPFGDRFDFAILKPILLGIGKFSEVALFDRQLQLLLTTDALVTVPNEPPPIVQLDPYPLLFHARDRADQEIIDTPANRSQGWQRIVLFTFYFRPGCLEIAQTLPMLKAVSSAPDRSRRAFLGLYPFHWQKHWDQSFQAIQNQGRPFVAPILQQLILNRNPTHTLAWVERVATWDFQTIISCHFAAPIAAGREDWRQAFAFLTTGRQLPATDFALLEQIDRTLCWAGILPSPEPSLHC
jgi:Domain of unknown function (DUF4336)